MPLFILYMSKLAEIEEKVSSMLNEQNYELVDIQYCHGGKNNILRIFIDKEGGITHDDCGYVSEQIGLLLDNSDSINSRYMLEVSSPGLDRKLKKDSDYIKFRSRKVRIKLYSPIDGRRNLIGYIRKYESGILTISPAQTANQAESENDMHLELKNIALARLEPEIKF